MEKPLATLAAWVRHHPGVTVFALCALPRLIAFAALPDPPHSYYWTASESLLHAQPFGLGGGEASTYLELAYPGFLALARWLTGDRDTLVMLIQIGVAALGGVALFRLTALLGGPFAAGAAAGLYAFNPYLVRQSGAYLEITLVIVCLIVSTLRFVEITDSRSAGRCGLWIGLTVLARTSLALIPCGFVLLLAAERRWKDAVTLTLAVVCVLLPWTFRNLYVDGSWTPSRLGENLFVSTSEYTARVLPGHDIDVLIPFANEIVEREAAASGSERDADRILIRHAVDFARAHPWRTLKLKLTNAVYLFSPRLIPFYRQNPETQAVGDGATFTIVNEARRPWIDDAAHAAAQSVLLGLGAAGLYLRRRGLRRDRALLVVAASVAIVNILFFPTTRLVAPMFFVLMFYAGCALAAIRSTSAAAPRPR